MLERETVQMGEMVLKQGAAGNHAYMIVSGKIEISVRDADGDEIHLADLGPGNFVGEMAAMFGGKRCATARAQEETILIPISGHDLQDTARHCASMQAYLTELIARRIHDTQTKIIQKMTEKMLGKS